MTIFSRMKHPWLGYGVIFIGIGIVISAILMSLEKPSIRVGFVAQLTGKQAELGVQERNGVLLAIEEINARNGIDGRKIELLVRDDRGVPEAAQSVDQELIDAGVVAIIGHATSGQTTAGFKVTNPAKMILLSPTTSTPELSGQDDYFFRVYPTFKDSAQAFAEYAYKTTGVRRLAVIYDTDNAAYAQTYSKVFSTRFVAQSGVIAGELLFSSAAQPDFQALLEILRHRDADALLIVASDIDTALIAQRVRIMGWDIPLLTSAWAQTETLINNGGSAVDGLLLEQSYALNSQAPRFSTFKSNFNARFGQSPSFGAAFGYEAAMVLAFALKNTRGRADGLKNALLEVQDFKGLVDNFSLDRFGDVKRPFYLTVIKDSKFVIDGKLN